MKIKLTIVCICVVMLGSVLFEGVVPTVFASIEEQEQLQIELEKIEQEIKKIEQDITATKGEKKTLSNRLYQLRQEQEKIKLQLQATAMRVKELDQKIKTTEERIREIEEKKDRLRSDLASLLRALHQRNHEARTFRLVLQGKFADAAIEVRNLEQLSDAIGELLEVSKKIRKELDEEKIAHERDQDDASRLLALASAEQSALGGKISEQNKLLKDTEGKEQTYQELLQGTKKQAAEIKSRIYELLDVGEQITFGEAVTIAEWVSGQVGVEASLLLAILTQESNLGKNVGTCNRLGDPPEKSWKVIMKPTRDQEPFKKITEELGKDPDITPVSCPMKNKDGSQLGWGGAMGPAQFIPSTWMGYKGKVTAITGKPADPWDIRDAFLASALLLKANGADGTRDGNWKAAMRYFSGGTNPAYSFYGDNVLALADKYKEEMGVLQ
jgi:peptidoglycan hydrolase CwlO-like protein